MNNFKVEGLIRVLTRQPLNLTCVCFLLGFIVFHIFLVSPVVALLGGHPGCEVPHLRQHYDKRFPHASRSFKTYQKPQTSRVALVFREHVFTEALAYNIRAVKEKVPPVGSFKRD